VKREYPDAPVLAVGAAVCRGGQVLVIQRGREPSLGIWTLPGGVVELGEGMQDALMREVREECGIEIEIGPVVGTLDNIVFDRHGVIQYHYAIVDFAARYARGMLTVGQELLAAAWITPQQFDEYDVSQKARSVFYKALMST
jgi:ADP-ribose pyrophosphatase YjhB (NUDIX family)